MHRPAALALLTLAGCVTETSFPRQAASISCSRLRECEESTYDDLYDDPGECVDETFALWDDATTCLRDAGCEFDADDAASCLQELRTADCDAVTGGTTLEGCLDAYACDLSELLAAGACLIF